MRDRIQAGLERSFRKHRIVFWHDPEARFREEFDAITSRLALMIPADPVARDFDGLGPRLALIRADPCLIAKGLAAMAIAHEEPAVSQPQKMGR